MLVKKIFCIISCVIHGLFAYCQMKANDVYKFPIKQGTEEWWQFETIEKRIVALQMPDTVLVKISTEGLLVTCLDFPYLISVLFGDNAQHGFEALMDKFNGFRELFKRLDLTDVLLEKYKSLIVDFNDIQLLKDVEQGRFTFRHFVLEFMFAQDAVLKNLSFEQEKQLFTLSFEHKRMKQNYSNIFSNLNDMSTNLLYAKKIMNDSDFKFENAEMKKALSDFIKKPVVIDQRTVGFIEDYINVKYK